MSGGNVAPSAYLPGAILFGRAFQGVTGPCESVLCEHTNKNRCAPAEDKYGTPFCVWLSASATGIPITHLGGKRSPGVGLRNLKLP